MNQEQKRTYTTEIPTLEKGFAIVELIAAAACQSSSGGDNAGQEGVSFSHISSTLGIAKASLARLLRTLITLGYVIKNPETGLYGPGEKIALINRQATIRTHLLKHARPILQELSNLTNSTAILFYWTGNAFEAIDKEVSETSASLQVVGNIDTGAHVSRQPWWWIYLADCPTDQHGQYLQRDQELGSDTLTDHLDFVKQNGYACDDGQFHQGLFRFAVPIRNYHNSIVAVLGMGVLDTALKHISYDIIVQLLKQKGAQLSESLGFSSIQTTAL